MMTVPEGWTFWHVLGAVVLVVAGSIVGSWASGVVGVLLERTQLDPGIRRVLTRFVRPLVVFVAVVVALEWLAVDLTAVLVLLAAAAIAVALAVQPTLAHFVSGDHAWLSVRLFVAAGRPLGIVALESTWLPEYPGLRVLVGDDGALLVELKWARKTHYRQSGEGVALPLGRWVRVTLELIHQPVD